MASINCCIPPRRAVKIDLGADARRLCIPVFWGSGLGACAHLAVRCQHAPGERTVLRLHLDQARQHSTRTQLGCVAAVNAGEQRIGKPIDGFSAEMALDQRGDSFIGQAARARQDEAVPKPFDLGRKAEQSSKGCGNQLCRHQEHEPVRQCDEAVAHQDVRLAIGVVGGKQLSAQAELAAEFRCRRLFGQKGVGPTLDDGAVDDFRGERSAQAVPAFVEDVGERSACGARLLELKSRSQPRDAAADDRNPHHWHYPIFTVICRQSCCWAR